ncbi:hemerythrin domain-containing protein [Mesorhizobium sp.]|uniref:hemerythrin domain-containing protein n=2 Tax=Mesorhizobium TaxID=68287 RepID=UPI003420D1D1
MMRRAHRQKLRLCDTLEQLADALPHVDRLQCLGVANSIVPLLRAIHRYEETVVFPAYEAALTLAESNLASIRRSGGAPRGRMLRGRVDRGSRMRKRSASCCAASSKACGAI